mmetsp:Transcript_36168/g.58290  ORF Transcript_36168/g.58290 Transcript_36168/m.58290 type:complete len:210 (+) Transcript_36168:115-744(+)
MHMKYSIMSDSLPANGIPINPVGRIGSLKFATSREEAKVVTAERSAGAQQIDLHLAVVGYRFRRLVLAGTRGVEPVNHCALAIVDLDDVRDRGFGLSDTPRNPDRKLLGRVGIPRKVDVGVCEEERLCGKNWRPLFLQLDRVQPVGKSRRKRSLDAPLRLGRKRVFEPSLLDASRVERPRRSIASIQDHRLGVDVLGRGHSVAQLGGRC